MRHAARPLLYVATLLVVLGFGRIHAQFIGHYIFHTSERVPWTLAYAGVLAVMAYGLGLPDMVQGRRRAIGSAVAAAISAAGLISIAQIVVGSLLLPRFVVFVSAAALIPVYVACAALASAGRSRDSGRDRVLAVITDAEADALRADLGQQPERSASLVMTLAPGGPPPDHMSDAALTDAAATCRATVLVLDRDAQLDETTVAQAAVLHQRGIRVRTLSAFYDEWLGKLPVAELERISLMFDIGELHRVRYGRFKRLADIALGLAGVAVLMPVTVLVLVGDLVANRGPLLFRQPRVGKGGSEFEILKFRTMAPGTDATEWTDASDARITPFGRWLRRTHLDELPQVVNIVRGDLSIVGPRPEQPHYSAELSEKIPFYDFRQTVRPGLTGWAQVKYAYGASELDAVEKLQYEFYYLRHQSAVLDARIIGRTLRSVIGRRGR